jgi:hypothetical protein
MGNIFKIRDNKAKTQLAASLHIFHIYNRKGIILTYNAFAHILLSRHKKKDGLKPS